MRSGKKRLHVEDVRVDKKRRRTGVEVPQEKVILKSVDEIWLVGHPLEKIATHALPTARQAYLRFRYLKRSEAWPRAATEKFRSEDSRFKRLGYLQILATKVIDEVAVFWHRGGYELKDQIKCREELLSIHNEWLFLSRSQNDSNVGSIRQMRRDAFISRLDGILDLNPTDWEDRIRKTRKVEAAAADIRYMQLLLNGEKTGGIGAKDLNHQQFIHRKQTRIQQEEKRRTAELHRQTSVSTEVRPEEPLEETADNTALDPDYVPCITPETRKPEYVHLRLPRNFVKNPMYTVTADRTRTSNSQLALITTSLLKIAGAKANDIVLSNSTIRRHRLTNRVEVAEEIKTKFTNAVKQSNPFLCLHWDEKMMPMVSGSKLEQIAIVVTGGEYVEGKLLAAVPLQNGCGNTMAEKTKQIVDDWEVTTMIGGLVFDTTSANTGCYQGAATLLEASFGRKMMWLACRRHIAELSLGAAWRSLFGDTKSKDNLDFKDFQTSWNGLQCDSPVILNITDPHLLAEKESSVAAIRSANYSNLRDDYREAADLALVMLGEMDMNTYKWRRPGAFSHARWMAHIIYGPKMLAFSRECGYDKEFVHKLEIFVTYTCLFYVPYWLKTPHAADAPMNDLTFFKVNTHLPLIVDIPEFSDICENVVDTFERHTWYLSEELVMLTLFSSVEDSVKETLVKKLLSIEKPTEFVVGKPHLPTVLLESELSDFVGTNSWLIFSLVSDCSWLNTSPGQ